MAAAARIPAPLARLAPTGAGALRAGAVLGLLLLVGIPLLLLIFSSVRGPQGVLPFQSAAYFTADNFAQALTHRDLLPTLRDTAFYVGGAVALSLLIAFPLAWLAERADLPFPNALFVLVLVPFLLPQGTLVRAWSGYLMPRTGELNVWLRGLLDLGVDRGPLDPYNLPTMVVAQGLVLTPVVFLVLAATLRNLDGAMEEASRAAGASALTTARRVTLPLVFPGVFTAAVLAAWLTLDSTTVPFIFGGQAEASLLNFRIWAALNPPDQSFSGFGLASAFALLAMLLLGLLFGLYAFTTRRVERFATVTGRSARSHRAELGYWSIPAAAFVLAYLALMWGLPGYRLVRGSMVAGLSGYWAQLTNPRFLDALFNSAVMSIGSATIGTIVVVLVAWVVVRSRAGPWRTGLDLLATASLVIPAAVAGVAFLMAFLMARELSLYGSLAGVTYALAYRVAIPYRIANASMRQLGAEMEEASATSGAPPFTTLRRITFPLLAPAVSISWIFFFVFAVRESTIVRYLGFVEPTIGAGSRFVRGGPPGSASAGTVLTFLFILGTILLVRWLLFRWGRLR